jgi:hypothetical protein
LERYLRTFPYTLEVPAPPVGEEITDYFLFTLGKGYCDYYATSMVVLARAAGIPARLVTGYILEQPDPEGTEISIAADQAHSWVEIYFPEIGWIPFEPTAGRPAISRTETRPVVGIPELDLSLDFLIEDKTLNSLSWLKWPGLVAASLMVVYVSFLLIMEIRFQRQPADSLLPAIFSRLYLFGQRLGVQSKPGDSSSEYLARLSQGMDHLATRFRWKAVLLDSVDLLVQLDQMYQKHLFKHSFSLEQERALIARIYSRLRIRLVVFWFMIKMARIPVLKRLITIWGSQPESIRV